MDKLHSPDTKHAWERRLPAGFFKLYFVSAGKMPALPGMFLLICFLAVVQGSTSWAQGEQSILNAIQTLERTIGLTSNQQASALERVSALEQRVFGRAGSGSLLTRLNNLRATVLGVQGNPARPAPQMPPFERPTQAAPYTGPPLSYPPLRSAPAGENPPQPVVVGDPLAFVNASPPRFVRIDPPNSKVKTSGDYYSSVLKATKGKTFRFKAMPIPVYITPFPDRDFTNSVVQGFEAWEHQTDGLIRFVQVDNPDSARIRVTWKHLGSKPDETGCTLGAHTITKWKTKSPGSLSVLSVGVVPVPIYIPTRGPRVTVPPQVIEVNLDLILEKDREIRYQVLQNVVTHELGHALGILGHSPYKEDMMYPLTDEHSRLSPRDITTINRIYVQKADIPL